MTTGLPDFFEPLLGEHYAPADVERVIAGSSAQRAVTLRANTLLSSRDEVATALDAAGITWEGVSWYPDAFVLADVRERAVWDLPIYQEGKVYLQSLSSMIPALVLDPQPGDDVCDMCAAPGGKTTQLAALGGPRAYITACEMHAPRADKLQHNLQKLGAANVTVMRVDARQMDDFFSFSRILLDAPCSGSGTLKTGDPKVAKRFTPALIEKSRKSQRALLDKALRMVKPGGFVVYSTCSVLACENEDIVTEGLKRARKRGAYEVQPVALEGADDWPLLPCALEGALCLAPTNRYEGFFVAKVKCTDRA